MAIIYVKPAVPTDQYLILGPREALIYPFDVGEWQVLRYGIQIGMTSATTPSGNFTNETVGNIIGNRANSWYIGLKDSGNGLPQTSGTTYIGYGSPSADNQSAVLSDPTLFFLPDMGDNSRSMVSHSVIATGFSNTNSSQRVTNNPGSDLPGVKNYTTLFEVRRGSHNGYNWLAMYKQAVGDDQTPTIAFLRALLQTSNSFTFMCSGFITDTVNAAGNNVPLPNSLFFYMPFFSNRLMINTLVVEKMS